MIYLPWSISLSIINGRPFPLHFPMFSRQAGARLEGRHGTEAGQVGRPAATRLGWWKHPYRMMEIGGNWRRFWTQRSDKIWDIIKYITYIIYTYIYTKKYVCVMALGYTMIAIFGVFSWTIWGNMSEYWIYGIKLPYKTNNSGGYDTGYVTNENGITMGRWMGIYNVFMVFNLTYGILIL